MLKFYIADNQHVSQRSTRSVQKSGTLERTRLAGYLRLNLCMRLIPL